MSRLDAVTRYICWLCVEHAGGLDVKTTTSARKCYKKFGENCGVHVDGVARSKLKRLINREVKKIVEKATFTAYNQGYAEGKKYGEVPF